MKIFNSRVIIAQSNVCYPLDNSLLDKFKYRSAFKTVLVITDTFCNHLATMIPTTISAFSRFILFWSSEILDVVFKGKNYS